MSSLIDKNVAMPPPLCLLFTAIFKKAMEDSDNYNSSEISRRSFIKKSVVASVAAGNLTMFSGLVNAKDDNPSEPEPLCIPQFVPRDDGDFDCYWDNADDQNCWRDNFECYDFDDDNEAGHGDGFGDPKTVNCFTADAPNLGVRCQSNARPFPRNLV